MRLHLKTVRPLIQINGSEAGGQILRTACALSALTSKPFKITNIRGAKPEPGLKTQHIEGVKAVAQLCNAEVTGLELGSTELEFIPGKLECKDIDVNISTAGSIGLVLQSLSIIAPGITDHIHVRFNGGGTWNRWAPPVLYLEKVFNWFVGEFLGIEIERDGFYPKGGALVHATIEEYDKKRIDIVDAGKLKKIDVYSIAAKDLAKGKVAERQGEEAKRLLTSKFLAPVVVTSHYTDTISPGSGVLIVARTENSIFGADALGERTKSAEEVAREAVRNLVSELSGSVDRHTADMLLPFMALSGGKIKTPEITQHIITNIDVIEKFLDVKFEVEGMKGRPGTISVL